MFATVAFGCGAVFCVTGGTWLVLRQRRRRADTMEGWGVLFIGAGQLMRAVRSLTGDREPLGLILTLLFAAASLTGSILFTRGLKRTKYGYSGWKRRKLPPIRD
ncbi:hypothetical protein [Streptomyces beihaiensis]|uniref:Uncharacterized protein n=1 Tax=Streptomyces beihaiensis TaxID=2984495 RepID=A0ABT3U1J9_9ACTN|nr:hypothetical protein [Streptomyces beihaiensis]MCX3063200.1 hypothetical protein [Streptomyces beihaiensis]